MKKVLKAFLYFLAGLIIVVSGLAVALRMMSPGTPQPITDRNGKTIPGSISAIEKITLGGYEQYIIVRGAGKSYSEDIPPETMNVRQFISDARELSQKLIERFSREKIFLMGHSWGSFLGILTAYRYPQLYHAYFGVGQVCDQYKGEQVALELVKKAAVRQHDEKAVRELSRISFPDSLAGSREWLDYLKVQRSYANEFGYGIARDFRGIWPVIKLVLQAKEYTLGEKLNALQGSMFSLEHLWPEIIQRNLFCEIDSMQLPVYILQGKYDAQSPHAVAEDFYEQLKAPRKAFYTFHHSAHSPVIEETAKFNSIVKEKAFGNELLAGSLLSGQESSGGSTVHEKIRQRTDEIRDYLIAIRRDLHEHPELPGQERKTSKIVEEYLLLLGLDVRSHIGGYGVVGILNGRNPGKKIAWRADMDAMETGHIRGHDVHTAIGMGVANVLAAQKENINGTIYFIFQPSEENFEGALSMIDDGLFELIDPVEIYALHVNPIPAGSIAAKPNEVYARMKVIRITYRNTGNGEDKIDYTKTVLNELTQVETVLTGSHEDLLTGAIAKARQRLRNSEFNHDLVSIEYAFEYPTMMNDPHLTKESLHAISDVYGEQAVAPVYGVVPGFNDDFCYFQQNVPGVYFFLGASDFQKGLISMPHSPDFAVDEECIVYGIRYAASMLVERLNKHKSVNDEKYPPACADRHLAGLTQRDAYFPGLLALCGDLERAGPSYNAWNFIWNRHGLVPTVYDYDRDTVINPYYQLNPEINPDDYVFITEAHPFKISHFNRDEAKNMLNIK